MTAGRGDGATAEEHSRIVQLGGHHRSGLCSPCCVLHCPNWKRFPTQGCARVEGRELIARVTQDVWHRLPSIRRAKAAVMEKTSNSLDPESLQTGAAAPHWRDSKATFPPLGAAWEKKSAFNKIGLRHGRGPQAPLSKVRWTLFYWGSPNLFILIIIRILYSVQTCLELLKHLQGVSRCKKKRKKNTLKTVQIRII